MQTTLQSGLDYEIYVKKLLKINIKIYGYGMKYQKRYY